jgi:hypothetical protein
MDVAGDNPVRPRGGASLARAVHTRAEPQRSGRAARIGHEDGPRRELRAPGAGRHGDVKSVIHHEPGTGAILHGYERAGEFEQVGRTNAVSAYVQCPARPNGFHHPARAMQEVRLQQDLVGGDSMKDRDGQRGTGHGVVPRVVSPMAC